MTTFPTQEAVTAYLQSPEFLTRERRRLELAHELHETKGVNFITAVIMAGDLLTAEDATERVKNKELTPLQALNHVGSYAKFDWALKHLTKIQLLKRLPYLWMSSDPDDSNPEYLKLWKQAFKANANKTILYKKHLPKCKMLTIYRGQIGKDNPGFAWTTNWRTAFQFSKTGGGRGVISGGVVLKGIVPKNKVLAYITERGEFEVIVDPKNVEVLCVEN